MENAQVALAVKNTLPASVGHTNVLLGVRHWQVPQNLTSLTTVWQDKIWNLCTKYGLIKNNVFNWRYFWNSIAIMSIDDIFFLLLGWYTVKKGGE